MYGYQKPRGLDCTVEKVEVVEPIFQKRLKSNRRLASEDTWIKRRKALREARQGLNRRCAIYRHYDEYDRLLYVGKSVQPLNRQQQHELEAHWFDHVVRIEIQWFHQTDDMDEAELSAIERENPLFNIARW